jgi:CheY-like chemotaxis protein
MQRDKDTKEACILVVDDNEDAREAMVAILQMKGYCVASAQNGRERLITCEMRPLPI